MARSGSLGQTTVRIRLDADVRPITLLDENVLLAQAFEFAEVGYAPKHATLADMPSAAALEIVLPAEAVRIVPLRVPAARPAMIKRALPHLIEDVIIGETSECHAIVLPGLRADGLRDVAIVDRIWMRLSQRIAQLRKPKRVSVVAAPWLMPSAPAGEALIVIDGAGGYIKHSGGVLPFAVGTNGAMPAEVRVARTLFGAGPIKIAGATPGIVQTWGRELGLPVEAVDQSWWRAAPLDASWSLMTDEYLRGAATGGFSIGAWRWPIGLAAACAIVAIVGLNAQWWQLAHERNAINARMESDLRTAFPKETVIVDPIRQARRAVASASGANDDTYLAMTEAVANAIDPGAPVPALLTLDYRGQVLRTKLAKGVDATQVADRLRDRGFEVSNDAAGADGAQPLVIRKKAAR